LGAAEERKALDRLTRAARNLADGARLGAALPPPAEGEAPAPNPPQDADAGATTPEPPAGR